MRLLLCAGGWRAVPVGQLQQHGFPVLALEQCVCVWLWVLASLFLLEIAHIVHIVPVSVIAFYHICLDGCAKQKVFFEWMSMLVAVIGIRRSGLKWTAFSILLMQHLCVRGRIFITVNRRRDICLEVKPQWCQRSINTCLIMTCFLFLLTKCICQLIRFVFVWLRLLASFSF